MTSYIRIVEGSPQPYSLAQLRADNPQVSFPVEPNATTLADFDVHPVAPADPPPIALTESLAASDPVLVDGVWTQQWDVTPLPLEEAKAVLWERVKAIRESLTDAPGASVATPFGSVQSDAKSQRNITGLVTMALIAKSANAPFSEPFTLADNSVATLNADQTIGLGVAVGQHVAAVYTKARQLRAAIEAAANRQALEAIDVEAGWP